MLESWKPKQVTESMNRDLNRVSVWCNLWGMKLNASKTKTMLVSRSSTVHPQLTPLTLDGTVLKESADLVILGVTFDAKMTFEKHLRAVSSAAAQRLGITRKSWQVFRDRSLLLRSFWSFVFPVLEYYSAVWCSAADSHLKLLDKVIRSAGFLAGGVLECNLAHSRSVAELCMLFKIKSNTMHPFFVMCLGILSWLRVTQCNATCSFFFFSYFFIFSSFHGLIVWGLDW